MSDDLISRSALLESVNYYYTHTPNDSPEHYAYGVTLKEIREHPTAFDKEKVKEQIQIFRSKFECTCCPKNIGKHIPVSCDECMDTFAKVNIVIVEKGGIE